MTPRIVDKQNHNIDLAAKVQQYFGVLFQVFGTYDVDPYLVANADETFTQVENKKSCKVMSYAEFKATKAAEGKLEHITLMGGIM